MKIRSQSPAGSNDVSQDPPVDVMPYLTALRRKMQTFGQKFSSDEVSFQAVLRMMEDSKLDEVLTVMQSRKGTTEDKIAYVADLVLEDLSNIDLAVAHLKNTKIEMLEMIASEYARAYGVMKAGTMTYANENFISEVKRVQEFRKGMRALTADTEALPTPEEGGCVSM